MVSEPPSLQYFAMEAQWDKEEMSRGTPTMCEGECPVNGHHLLSLREHTHRPSLCVSSRGQGNEGHASQG